MIHFDFRQISILAVFFLSGCGGSPTKEKALSPEEVKKAEKSCIETVLRIDDSLGTIRNHACETVSLSQAVTNYTESLGKIDFRQCPAEFTEAFNIHKKAWINFKQVSDIYPALRGEMHDLFDTIEKSADSTEFKKQSKLIWDTWAKIDEIAKKG